MPEPTRPSDVNRGRPLPAWACHSPAVFRRGLAGPLALFLVCASCAPTVAAQVIFAKTAVRVSPQGVLSAFWDVREARLDELFDSAHGYLDVQNKSGAPLQNPTFYAEYLDAGGRFCLSLVFSLQSGVGRPGPILPGETREFQSTDYNLFPATQPQEARIYLVRQTGLTPEESIQNDGVPFRAPTTLFGGLGGDFTRAKLEPSLSAAKAPVVDLVLAEVDVNDEGGVDDVHVLDRATPGAALWFGDFARRHMEFYPATTGRVTQPSRALILARVLLSEEGVRGWRFPPRLSPWVRSYVAAHARDDLPPVADLILQRPATTVRLLGKPERVIHRPAAPAGTFELVNYLFEWSVGGTRWVADPSMPRGTARVLALGSRP